MIQTLRSAMFNLYQNIDESEQTNKPRISTVELQPDQTRILALLWSTHDAKEH